MAGKHLKNWRAGIRSIQVESPTKQFILLRATASSAGQPQGRAFVPLVARLTFVAACGPGPSGLGAMSQGRAALPGEQSCSGPGRAEITGSREGAKPRRFDESRINFCQCPWTASVEPVAGQGHPGL